jgi:urease accessory protein
MNRQFGRLSLSLIVLALGSAPAFAHHVMGGRTPATFVEGVLSGLGHPVIGLDHLAAVVAIGCLAAAHREGYALASYWQWSLASRCICKVQQCRARKFWSRFL